MCHDENLPQNTTSACTWQWQQTLCTLLYMCSRKAAIPCWITGMAKTAIQGATALLSSPSSPYLSRPPCIPPSPSFPHSLSLPPPALPLPPSQVLTCWGSSGRPQAPGPAPATIQGCPPRPAALPALLPAAVLKSPPVQQRQLCSACGQPLPCLAPCWQQLWRQCCCLYCCLLGSGYVWLHGGWT